MKKKGPRDIPDFSPKRPTGSGFLKFEPEKPLRRPTPPPLPRVKPPSTSAKSGRRGT